MKTIVVAVCFSALCSTTAFGSVLTVPTPYLTIQDAIDAAVAGDTVVVYSGVYIGDGNRDIDFLGKPIVVMAECRYDSTIIDSTVIDCQGSQEYRGFYFHSGETNDSVLEGFIIENGGTDIFDAGIVCDSTSSPTIKYNTIRDCYGSGIYCHNSSPLIDNNLIIDNAFAYSGGGIHCSLSSAIITNNEIAHNSPHEYGNGAGICCSSCSTIVINNNFIHDNCSDEGNGVGIYINASRASIIDNTITNNWGGCGGGIYAIVDTLVILDNDITQNRAIAGGGGIICYDSHVTIDNNNLLNNTFTSRAWAGGGMYLNNCDAIISSNNVSGNSVIDGYGGGFWISGSTIHIYDNTISTNSAAGYGMDYHLGGGIYIISSTGRVNNNLILNNGGGGIACYCDIEITNNIISSNSTYYGGGGIGCKSSSPVIVNNTICNNIATYGSGIFCEDSSPVVTNNIIVNNQYNSGGNPFEYPPGGIVYVGSYDPNIECCDVFNNEVANYVGISDQTGFNGNISTDPLFCDPVNGEYSLNVQSPCMPGNHPDGYDCELIGALGIGCALDEPYISLIEDIKNDQGRQVSIKWYRCFRDSIGAIDQIQTYEIYRRIDELPVLPSFQTNQIPIVTPGSRSPALLYPPGDWHYLFSVPAHCEDVYFTVAPTLEDSCAHNDSTLMGDPLYFSTFFIRATTDEPSEFYDSSPDSGYSVDNLAPSVPTGFAVAYNTGSGIQLTWDECPDADFQYYCVYRETKEDFIPSPDNLEKMTILHAWTDSEEGGWYYKITAIDHNGNESDAASPDYVTGDLTPCTPKAFALHQNVPNPFNPSTLIRFDLPHTTFVKLYVYDVSGRLVRTLVNAEMEPGRKEIFWNGTDNSGRQTASGIYFYHLTAGSFSETKKMVLLK